MTQGHEDSPEKFEEGQKHSHNDLDTKDSRSLSNRVAAAEKAEKEEESKTITDPLAPARAHGNKPSRGAEVDAEIMKAEEEELKNKGKA